MSRRIQPTTQTARARDRILATAVRRGAKVREKLRRAEGGSVSAAVVAKILGIPEHKVLALFKTGRLLGWRNRTRKVRFPVWQFHSGELLPGLEEALRTINETARVDDSGRLLFFLSRSQFLNGKRPLDLLRNRTQMEKVLQAARSFWQPI